MPSSLTWIAHDREEHDRVNRILAALKQSEARDEMGLGAVRDALADLLFPGTTTIQTRSRYFLIVPWCYQAIEAKRIRHPKFGPAVDKLERDLIAPLLQHDDVAGVFGRVSGDKVKRLPSSVYWAGLAAWGIRKLDFTQTRYHRHIDQLYARRGQDRRTDEGEAIPDALATMWDPDLPAPPPGFPEQLDLTLQPAEAAYLRDRIQTTAPQSMLALLAQATHLAPMEGVPYPWRYPGAADFPPAIREALHHAQVLSETMWGAALLYNWQLAGLTAPDGAKNGSRPFAKNAVQTYNVGVPLFSIRVGLSDLRLGTLAGSRRCAISRVTPSPNAPGPSSRHGAVVCSRGGGHVESSEEAKTLIRQRELFMKRSGGRSRFHNAALRDIWGGTAGIGRMQFRWPGVHVLLSDITPHWGVDRHARYTRRPSQRPQ